MEKEGKSFSKPPAFSAAAATTTTTHCPHPASSLTLPSPSFTTSTTSTTSKSFLSIPGPRIFDVKAFRLKNHHYITSLHEQYGDIIRVESQDGGRKSMVYVRNPSTVKHVLMSETKFDKTFADANNNSSSYLQYFKNLVQPLLASADLFGSGDNSSRRQNLKKTFSASPDLLPAFQRAVHRSLTSWPQKITKEIDLVPIMHHLVFNLVMVIMAGDDFMLEESDHLFEACSSCLSYYQKRYSTPLFDEQINKEDEFWMKKVEVAGMEVTKVLQKMYRNQTLGELAETSMIGVMQHFGMSDAEMNATMINALFAACEAPVHILVSSLIELSQRPDMQEELNMNVSTMENGTEDDMDELYFGESFLNNITMESLRSFAPVTLVQRCAIHDTMLEGYNVPAETVIGVCVASVHSNENYFPNSTSFNPYRQGLDMVVLNTGSGFMPFSSGPRGCPGRYLASTILKLGLARVVTKYKLTSRPNVVAVRGGSNNDEEKEEKKKEKEDRKKFIHKFVEWPMNGAFVGLAPRSPRVVATSNATSKL